MTKIFLPFVLHCLLVSGEQIRIEINQVGKAYGTHRVLGSVSAELQHGDALVVTGRNGAGKSTLLRIIAGLVRPSTGQVRYRLGDRTLDTQARRQHLGFVGPDVQVYRDLTAYEHLAFVARLHALLLDRAAMDQALGAVGLAGRGDLAVGGFSSGMRQRLRYALALLHQPPVLILDEPTTNLDAQGIAIVDDIVGAARERGIVILATNEQRDLHYGTLELALDTQTR
jgi:heme exporter protein A